MPCRSTSAQRTRKLWRNLNSASLMFGCRTGAMKCASIEPVGIHRQHAERRAGVYPRHARRRRAGPERDEEWQEMLFGGMVAGRSRRVFPIAQQLIDASPLACTGDPVAEIAYPARWRRLSRPVQLA